MAKNLIFFSISAYIFKNRYTFYWVTWYITWIHLSLLKPLLTTILHMHCLLVFFKITFMIHWNFSPFAAMILQSLFDKITLLGNVYVFVKTPTPTQHNTTVGFDMKMTVHTPPPHRNFSGTSKRARELKFGTDTH